MLSTSQKLDHEITLRSLNHSVLKLNSDMKCLEDIVVSHQDKYITAVEVTKRIQNNSLEIEQYTRNVMDLMKEMPLSDIQSCHVVLDTLKNNVERCRLSIDILVNKMPRSDHFVMGKAFSALGQGLDVLNEALSLSTIESLSKVDRSDFLSVLESGKKSGVIIPAEKNEPVFGWFIAGLGKKAFLQDSLGEHVIMVPLFQEDWNKIKNNDNGLRGKLVVYEPEAFGRYVARDPEDFLREARAKSVKYKIESDFVENEEKNIEILEVSDKLLIFSELLQEAVRMSKNEPLFLDEEPENEENQSARNDVENGNRLM